MKKVQLGTGSNLLEGWENRELDADIRKPLPYLDNEVDLILIEHVLEHITQKEAYNFFLECRRVLKVGGTIRIIIPDLKKIYEGCNQDYLSFIGVFFPAGQILTVKDAIEAIIFKHNHESYWSSDLLITILSIVGFKCSIERYRESRIPELRDVDGHWKLMGLDRCIMESVVVEASKI